MTAGNRSTLLTRNESGLLQTLSAGWTIYILLARHCIFGEIQDAVSRISNRVLSNRQVAEALSRLREVADHLDGLPRVP
jgi:hypothetical protein